MKTIHENAIKNNIGGFFGIKPICLNYGYPHHKYDQMNNANKYYCEINNRKIKSFFITQPLLSRVTELY